MAEKAKSNKAVGTGGGFFDAPIAWIKEAADEAAENVPLIRRLGLKDTDKQVQEMVSPTPPPPAPTTPQTRVKPQKKPTRAEAEKARKWIAEQKAKGVKNPVYKPEA